MSGDFCELIKKGIEVLIKEDFMGKGVFCVLDIPQTKNKAFIEAEKSAIRNGCFRFWISVGRTGSDYYTRNCMTGDKTEDELKEYLKTEYLENAENITNLQTTIMKLSGIVDDKEGEFPMDY